jgi:hypothetical protein
MLNPIRKIRNRFAHHEPVLYFDLPKHHANIVTLTDWLSPSTAAWAAQHSTFDAVYDEERARKLLPPKLR